MGVVGGAAFVIGTAFWFTWQFVEPAPPGRFVIATGGPDGAYHRYGFGLKDVVAEEGFTLELVNGRDSHRTKRAPPGAGGSHDAGLGPRVQQRYVVAEGGTLSFVGLPGLFSVRTCSPLHHLWHAVPAALSAILGS